MSEVVNIFIRNSAAGKLYDELVASTNLVIDYVSAETLVGVMATIILGLQLESFSRGSGDSINIDYSGFVGTNREIEYHNRVMSILNDVNQTASIRLQIGIMKQVIHNLLE